MEGTQVLLKRADREEKMKEKKRIENSPFTKNYQSLKTTSQPDRDYSTTKRGVIYADTNTDSRKLISDYMINDYVARGLKKRSKTRKHNKKHKTQKRHKKSKKTKKSKTYKRKHH